MKRFGLLFLLTVLAFHMGFAAPRSYNQARAIALQKAASLGINNPRVALSKQSPKDTEEQEGQAYYLFDNGNNRGFVIVSGDDKLPEVIGYATSGSLSEQEMPVQLKSLLEAFEKQYKEMAGDDARLERAMAERNALAESSAAANVTVSPLLGDIAWAQETPYNNQCPTFTNGQAATGCVATAMAQVIRYHQYPTQLQHDIPSYTSQSGFTSSVIPASSTTYDYDKMLEQYVSGNYSDEQASAVATLMLHCGCAVQMEYGVAGSYAITSSTSHVLGAYFAYDKSTLAFVDRCDYSLEEWCSIIDHELSHNRPIIYEGRTLSNEGHAFVCDGANGDGFYHINWGWSGSGNGYFDISILNPFDAESTTGAGGYNIGMGMTIGIKPSTEEGTAPIAKAKGLNAHVKSVDMENRTVNVDVYNMSYNDFTGWVALAVKEGTGHKLISVKTTSFNLSAQAINGVYYINSSSLTFNHSFPVGTTKVYMVYGSGETVIDECGGKYGKPHFYVTSDGTTTTSSLTGYSLSATLSSDKTIYNGINNDLTLKVTNSGVEEYLNNAKVYISSTDTKPDEASITLYLAVPANGGTTTRVLTVNPSEQGYLYVWVDDGNGNSLITAQKFTVEANSDPVLTLVAVESNATADRYETNNAFIKNGSEKYRVKAPKTFDESATFTFKMENTGGAADCSVLMQLVGFDGEGQIVQKMVTERIEKNETKTFTITATPEEVGSRYIKCVFYILDGDLYTSPKCSESLEELSVLSIDPKGVIITLKKNFSAVYVPETTSHATNLGNNSTYWATYSNQTADTELGVETGRELTLYNVTVSNGQMALTPRTGDYAYKVAKGEAVLMKTDGENVKVEEIGTKNGLAIQGSNDLKATPAENKSIQATDGKIFYRLTYSNMDSKKDLGFYKAVATVGGTKHTDGSWINATPNKGYLYISKTAATGVNASSPTRGFIFDGDTTTAIDDISVTDGDMGGDNGNEPLFNLQGQKVKNVGKGVYVKKNKKVIIK
ncbi:MAG: C10 family peptidase [Prevotella sp.]|nr:C10 family peptidase [Prevotella sp.]